jgi:hypothetical protein
VLIGIDQHPHIVVVEDEAAPRQRLLDDPCKHSCFDE